jgi:hypothetical protein
MRRQYIHLCAYPCDECSGPVVAATLTVRENEISKETDFREVGAVCLSCGHRQSQVPGANTICHFPPARWEPVVAVKTGHPTTVLAGSR